MGLEDRVQVLIECNVMTRFSLLVHVVRERSTHARFNQAELGDTPLENKVAGEEQRHIRFPLVGLRARLGVVCPVLWVVVVHEKEVVCHLEGEGGGNGHDGRTL